MIVQSSLMRWSAAHTQFGVEANNLVLFSEDGRPGGAHGIPGPEVGDGFAVGLIYGLLTGKSQQEALNLGWAHGALITTFPGDTTMATLDQVQAIAKGGSARIQR